MFLYITVIVLLILVIFFFLYLKFSHWGSLIAKIPSKRPWPLDDTMDMLRLRPDTAWKHLRTEFTAYGRISKVQMLCFAAVNLYHPDDVQTLLSTTRYNEKQIPYNFLRPWLGEGLLVSNGEKWKQRRKLLTPAFHFNILQKFCHSFNDHTHRLIKRIEESTETISNVKDLIVNSTLNIMCETSMGTPMSELPKSITNKYINGVHNLGHLLLERYFKIWLHFDSMFKYSLMSREVNKIVADLHEFTNKVIDERKTTWVNDENADEHEIYAGKKKLAMLDMLFENERDKKIDRNGIREEVETFMFEGHDTTAMALTFMIMRIANEPIIQDKIYEEVKAIFGNSDRTATTDDLNNMKYLEMCVKESLRIYPSVPFIARYVTEDVVLGEYTVPAETIIHIHVYDIHHDATIYPDPERFVPERFLPEATVARHPYAYLPFSAGPRNCIGQKFAMLEMKTVMSGLLRKFRIEPVTKPEDIVFIVDIILRSRNPIYLRFCPRVQ